MQLSKIIILCIILPLLYSSCKREEPCHIKSLYCTNLDTFIAPVKVGLGYSRNTAIVNYQDSGLAIFSKTKNDRYCIYTRQDTTQIAQISPQGKYFSIYKENKVWIFENSSIDVHDKNTHIASYTIPDSLQFVGSLNARPIITDELIIASVYPDVKFSNSGESYLSNRHGYPLFVVINRSSKKVKTLGRFPESEFPYNQTRERKYNGLEHSYCFTLVDNTLYFMFKISNKLYSIEIDTGRMKMEKEIKHCVFSDLGQNIVDEEWEKKNKGTYIASIPLIYNITPINESSELAIYVSKPQIYRNEYLNQLANNGYIAIFNILDSKIREVEYLKNHFPGIKYADNKIIVLKNRMNNEKSLYSEHYTIIPHDCL